MEAQQSTIRWGHAAVLGVAVCLGVLMGNMGSMLFVTEPIVDASQASIEPAEWVVSGEELAAAISELSRAVEALQLRQAEVAGLFAHRNTSRTEIPRVSDVESAPEEGREGIEVTSHCRAPDLRLIVAFAGCFRRMVAP